MGWRRGGSRVGFSDCLRVSLLCILGMVALECQTVPVAEKTPTQPHLVLLVKNKTDTFLEAQLGKSREKRSFQGVEVRYSNIRGIGIDESRFVPNNGTGTWENGKTCNTGQEPLNAAEIELTRQQIIRDVGEFSRLYAAKGPMNYAEASRKNAENCASKECHLDVPTLSLLCGPVTPKFKNGKSCLDGSEPLTQEAFMKTKTAQTQAKVLKEGMRMFLVKKLMNTIRKLKSGLERIAKKESVTITLIGGITFAVLPPSNHLYSF